MMTNRKGGDINEKKDIKDKLVVLVQDERLKHKLDGFPDGINTANHVAMIKKPG